MAETRNNITSSDLIDVGDISASLEDDITEPPGRASPSDILGASERAEGPSIAELRDRFAAFFLDILFLYILYWPLMLTYRTIALGSAAGPIPAGGIHGLIFHGIFLLIAVLWFVLTEMTFEASPGKLACHLAIRKSDGTPVSPTSVLIRNLLRPIDILLFPCFVLSALLEWTSWHRRLGDIAAGTVVIRKLGNPPRQYALSIDMIASATGRAFAFMIDLSMIAAFVVGYGLLLDPEQPVVSMLLVVLFPAVFILFLALPEAVFKTSPGKWIFGMNVCHEEGSAIDLTGALIRNIWKIIDATPIGFITVLISLRHQRSGDIAAGSVVVKAKREVRGFIGLLACFLMAGALLYAGLGNESNLLSGDFEVNFLPSIEFGMTKASAKGPQQNLSIQDFQFAEGEQKTPRRPSIYESGETVYIAFNVDGYSKKGDGVWIQEDLTIRYPDGSVGLKLENINDFNQKLQREGYIQFENNIEIPANAQPGRYTVVITLRDRISNRELKEQRFFYVTVSNEGKDKPAGAVESQPGETIKVPAPSETAPKPKLESTGGDDPDVVIPAAPMDRDRSLN